MAYLMHIAFDNSHRLERKSYLFEYRGVHFRLVQDNPRRHADHLLTLLPTYQTPAREAAFLAGSEFCSALAWELGSRVAVWEQGGSTRRDGIPLGRCSPNMFTFPRIPYAGFVVGTRLHRLPQVETDSQRIALTLFREAGASNNDYLSFLFYWQVLEVDADNPAGRIDRIYRKDRGRLRLYPSDIATLPLQGRSLGTYLEEDCRHAIAHIKRRPGRRKLDLDRTEERHRLARSAAVIRQFAAYHVRHHLGLEKSLYLVRTSPRAFPIFADDAFRAKYACRPAYD